MTADSPRPPRSRLPGWTIRVGTASWYFIGFCGAVALLGIVLTASRDIMIPLTLGIVLAVVFTPVTRALTERGVRRSISATLVMLVVVVIAAGSLLIVAAGLADQGDELAARIDEATTALKRWLDGLDIDAALVDSVRDTVNGSVGTVSAGLANHVVGAINSAAGLVTGTILGLVVLYYLLKDGPALVNGYIDRQSPARRAPLRRLADRSASQVQAYARGRTIMAAINGVVIGVAAALLGVPLAIAIAIVNFVGAYIPYFGAFVGGTFAFLMALSVGGMQLAAAIVGVSLLVNLVLENALEPVLLGDQLELHPLVVLLVTVVGGLMAGIVGLVLAAPLTAIGLNIFREIRATGFFDD